MNIPIKKVLLTILFVIGTITTFIGGYNSFNGQEILGNIQTTKGSIDILFCVVFYYLDDIYSKINH